MENNDSTNPLSSLPNIKAAKYCCSFAEELNCRNESGHEFLCWQFGNNYISKYNLQSLSACVSSFEYNGLIPPPPRP